MKEKTRDQLLKKIKTLQTRITELEKLESKHKELREVVIDSNRRLQENTQKLYIAQQELKVRAEKEKKLAAAAAAAAAERKRADELKRAKKEIEKKNKELNSINSELKEENKRITAEQKNMIEQAETVATSQNKEVTKLKERKEKRALKGLKVKYENLLGFYIKNDKKKIDSLVNELCSNFIQTEMPTKMIVELHITSVKKVTKDDINQRESQRKASTVRMVLLMVMTKYASLLRSAQTNTD